MSYVKNYFQYIKEALSKDQWFNYKEDTYLKMDNPGQDELRVANKVMELLDINDPSKIAFTSNNDQFNYDYRFFTETIFPSAKKELESGIKFEDYIVFYTLYTYQEKKIAVIYIKDTTDISYIFIKQEDFDFFGKLIGGDEEEETPEEKTQETGEETEERPSENL